MRANPATQRQAITSSHKGGYLQGIIPKSFWPTRALAKGIRLLFFQIERAGVCDGSEQPS
jgi:hypothetical protein